jgi:hypothetical protein
MIESRASTALSANPSMREDPRRDGEDNLDWLERTVGEAEAAGAVLLVGGSGFTDFRLRVAQSHARSDMLPSFWSHAALLGPGAGGERAVWEVSLEPTGGFTAVPSTNGIQVASLSRYADPRRFPNIAWVRFATEKALGKNKDAGEEVARAVTAFRKHRSVVDVPAHIVDWLAFAWGVADRANPLLRGMGVPAAVFVESVFSILGIDVTPGIESRTSCPEAIWQAAKWWHEYYESPAAVTGGAPQGAYVLGQPAAAVLTEDPRMLEQLKASQSKKPRGTKSRGRKTR